MKTPLGHMTFIPDKDMDALYAALFALCPTEASQQRLAEINKDRDRVHDRRGAVIQMMSHTIIAMEEM